MLVFSHFKFYISEFYYILLYQMLVPILIFVAALLPQCTGESDNDDGQITCRKYLLRFPGPRNVKIVTRVDYILHEQHPMICTRKKKTTAFFILPRYEMNFV